MQKKIIRPTPKWKFAAGIILAFVFLMAAVLLFSRLCSPALSVSGKEYTAKELAVTAGICHRPADLKEIRYAVTQKVSDKEEKQAAEFFAKYPDAAKETVENAVQKGTLPAWYPRNEAPVLQKLVKQGALPPLAQRIGPEPVVMQPLEGVHQYGGVWVQFVAGSGTEMHAAMARMTYAKLFRFSPLGYPIVPHLAKSYEVRENGRIWDITLRKVRWSDGHPYTADDIIYWFQDEYKNKALNISGRAPVILQIGDKEGRVEKLGPYKVRFILPEPRGNFLEQLAFQPVGSPKHYLKQFHPAYGDPERLEQLRQQYNVASKKGIYSLMKSNQNPELPRLDPWILRRANQLSPISYIRNPYYFAVDTCGNQLPYIDRIQLEGVDQLMMPMSVSSGRATMQFRYIRFENFAEYIALAEQNNYSVRGWLAGSRSEWLISPNLNRLITTADKTSAIKAKLLSDKEFRQALSLAIDRQTIVQAVYSGQAEPVQVDPGPYSDYPSLRMRHAYTRFDPAEANRKLDNVWKRLGLDPDKRTADGYRVDGHGRVPVFFLYFTDFTGAGPAQFVVDYWAQVGIRCVYKSLSRPLLNVRGSSRDFDFTVWSSESENLPVLSGRVLAVNDAGASFGRGWNKWYAAGGMRGDPRSGNPGCVAIPQDHAMYQAVQIYDRFRYALDPAERAAYMKQLTDIAAENVWTISPACAPPKTVVVSNDLKNVPEKALEGYMMYTPGNTAPETFSLIRFQKGTEEDTISQILKVDKLPAQNVSAPVMTRILRWSFAGIVILFLALVAMRHPFVLRRLVIMVPTLAIISVCVFSIIQLPPGDYLSNRIVQLQESGMTEEEITEQIDNLRDLFRFDDPAWKRYLRWMGVTWFVTGDRADLGLLQGNMGYSMETGKSVNTMVGDRILLTMLISFFTIIFTWAVALPIGIYSAVRQYSFADYMFTIIGFLGMCVPGFLLALILMALTGINSLFSAQYAIQPYWDLPKVLDMLKHIWAPVLVVGVAGTAGMIRIMRANLLDELRKPYVITARAKGVRPGKLLFKYPVRLALNPFISGIGGLFPRLISGSSIVAIVMSLPTVGPLMLGALFSQDMNMAGSMLMVLSTLSVFGTLVSDLLLIAIDPRIRIGGGSAK